MIEDKHLLALSMCKRSLAADFYQVFGREMTEQFLKLFGGTYLRVPTMTEFERNLRDLTIYQHIAARPNDIKQIMSNYGVNSDKLDTILKKVSAEHIGVEIPSKVRRYPRLVVLPPGFVRKPRL